MDATYNLYLYGFFGKYRSEGPNYLKRGIGIVVYFSIAFLCNAALFLFLLEDKYRIWTTLIGAALAYVLSLIGGGIFAKLAEGALGQQLACLWSVLVLFAIFFFLSVNNALQKLYLCVLCMSNFAFLSFFLPLFLGGLPFSTSGAPAGILSALLTLLFYLLTGLCLYRPLHHFSDRSISSSLMGITLIQLLCYFLCLGLFDFLFQGYPWGARLLSAVLFYCGIIFVFRSIYHAARFRQESATDASRRHMLETESGDFADMLASVKEVRAAQKFGEYALDTVKVMLREEDTRRVAEYVANAKRNTFLSPMLETYHEDPYINAVIATKATIAKQAGILFESSAVTGNTPLESGEICVAVNELLTKACQEAAEAPGNRKIHFSIVPAEDSLHFEAVYTAEAAEENKAGRLPGKTLSDLLRWLLEDFAEGKNTSGFENTTEMVGRYGGKVSVSDSAGLRTVSVAIRY